MNKSQSYYHGFVDTCASFGIQKEAADYLYKYAGVRDLLLLPGFGLRSMRSAATRGAGLLKRYRTGGILNNVERKELNKYLVSQAKKPTVLRLRRGVVRPTATRPTGAQPSRVIRLPPHRVTPEDFMSGRIPSRPAPAAPATAPAAGGATPAPAAPATAPAAGGATPAPAAPATASGTAPTGTVTGGATTNRAPAPAAASGTAPTGTVTGGERAPLQVAPEDIMSGRIPIDLPPGSNMVGNGMYTADFLAQHPWMALGGVGLGGYVLGRSTAPSRD